jgi:hypothetical protein
MLGTYLLALLLTVVIEGGVAYLLGLRQSQQILAFAMINVITNPVLNYVVLVLNYLGLDVSFLLIVALEILVVIVEWQLLVYIFQGPTGRFLLTSVLANTVSFLMGLLLFWGG